ncbi:hypothetical protein [Roseixanthobacter glucoisosaccharinicivorans]|uniref:hypothetical protein n=1 Tax=Roseixanthobacter glucoisosaccharinicivorans TaxID=3119923 RepID=UPI003729BC6A
MVASSTAANIPPRKHPPETAVSDFLVTLNALLKDSQYTALSDAFVAFAKTHPGLDFFIEEAIPARVADHVLSKTGAASAFTTFTLQNPNWAVELQRSALDPQAFAQNINDIEAKVAALAAAAKAPKTPA